MPNYNYQMVKRQLVLQLNTTADTTQDLNISQNVNDGHFHRKADLEDDLNLKWAKLDYEHITSDFFLRIKTIYREYERI